MYVYANVNPIKRDTDDCLVRAVAILFGYSWEKAYWDLCYRGALVYDMPNKDSTFSLYMKEKGFKREAIPNTCPACYSVVDFCIDHPKGEYILLTRDHAVAVIDGCYYDTTDSGSLTPQFYWVKEE